MYDLPDFAIKNTFLNLRHAHRTTKTEHFPLSIGTLDDDRKERSFDKPIIFDGIFSKTPQPPISTAPSQQTTPEDSSQQATSPILKPANWSAMSLNDRSHWNYRHGNK